MECNREEAERAKEIAEKKFKMKDIGGAKKLALKAQSLYPTMEGVPQMLAALDVYIAAENKEVDWYGILGASPGDDNETLKRKYRKLALMLHPDKNSFVGAEGAFKHVSEAWKFLSDKEKRAAYDRRRSLQAMFQKVSVSSSNSAFCSFAKTSSNARPPPTQKSNPPPPTQKSNPPPPTQKSNPPQPTQKNYPPPKPATQKREVNDHHTTVPSSFAAASAETKSTTFWTVCRRCMMQYEYLRTYDNCNLLCPDCLQPFLAVETTKPGMSSTWKRNLNPKSAANPKWAFSRTSSAAHVASVVQQAYEKVKEDREKAKAKKNAKRKSTTTDSSLKKRKVIGETETGGCSSGRKVIYYVTGEMGKLHADTLSPRMQKKKSRLHSESVEV